MHGAHIDVTHLLGDGVGVVSRLRAGGVGLGMGGFGRIGAVLSTIAVQGIPSMSHLIESRM